MKYYAAPRISEAQSPWDAASFASIMAWFVGLVDTDSQIQQVML